MMMIIIVMIIMISYFENRSWEACGCTDIFHPNTIHWSQLNDYGDNDDDDDDYHCNNNNDIIFRE
jgi:hypothetical protein